MIREILEKTISSREKKTITVETPKYLFNIDIEAIRIEINNDGTRKPLEDLIIESNAIEIIKRDEL